MTPRVPDPLLVGLRRFPDAICIADGERALSYAQVDQRASRLGAVLLARGVAEGDRVVLLTKNRVEFLEIQLACMRVAATLVPLNYRLTASEVSLLVRDAGARIAIVSTELRGLLTGSNCELLELGDDYEHALAGAGNEVRLSDYASDARNAILYTSGTTGMPKGAVLTNALVQARMNSVALEVRIKARDAIVIPMPAFHAVSCCVYAWVMMGACVVIPAQFEPVGVADLCEEFAATQLMVVPTMLRSICDDSAALSRDFSSLRTVLYGASSIAPAVLRRAMTALGCEFMQLYGSTEASPIALLRPEDHLIDGAPELLRSAGREAIGNQTRLVDEAGHDVEPGAVGEILVRGPVAVAEYWQQPELSASRGLGDWLKTGDAGYRDERGYLYVVDRVDDIIITGAENVSSREVEAALYEHAGVAEAAVVGVDDEHWGQRIHAVVVPGERRPTSGELMDHCRSRLSSFKVPKSIELVDELPMNSLGKLMKREIRRLANARLGPTDSSDAVR